MRLRVAGKCSECVLLLTLEPQRYLGVKLCPLYIHLNWSLYDFLKKSLLINYLKNNWKGWSTRMHPCLPKMLALGLSDCPILLSSALVSLPWLRESLTHLLARLLARTSNWCRCPCQRRGRGNGRREGGQSRLVSDMYGKLNFSEAA